MPERTHDWRHGAILPRDEGQIVYRTWHPIGADGVICATIDRSEVYDPENTDSVRLTLHEWADGDYEPQNGSIGCSDEERELTHAEAARLLDEWRGRV